MKTQIVGSVGEDKALEYLKKNGLLLVLRNYSCRLGEVDLIMRDGAYIVFIEVRVRRGSGFGGGVGSITPMKRQKIIKSATNYLMVNKLFDKAPIRFDVVSIDGPLGDLTWIKDAFGLDY